MTAVDIILGIVMVVSIVWSFIFVILATAEAFIEKQVSMSIGGIVTVVLGILGMAKIYL